MAVKPGFNIAQIHYVRREIKFNGRKYLVGQPFPWRNIGCAVRRLRQLYEMGKLEYKLDDDTVPEVEDESIEDESLKDDDSGDGSDDSNGTDDDTVPEVEDESIEDESLKDDDSGDGSDDSNGTDDDSNEDNSEDQSDDDSEDKKKVTKEKVLPKPRKRRKKSK